MTFGINKPINPDFPPSATSAGVYGGKVGGLADKSNPPFSKEGIKGKKNFPL
jgi:hypothetical protein